MPIPSNPTINGKPPRFVHLHPTRFVTNLAVGYNQRESTPGIESSLLVFQNDLFPGVAGKGFWD
jgi:hypothetical protein